MNARPLSGKALSGPITIAWNHVGDSFVGSIHGFTEKNKMCKIIATMNITRTTLRRNPLLSNWATPFFRGENFTVRVSAGDRKAAACISDQTQNKMASVQGKIPNDAAASKIPSLEININMTLVMITAIMTGISTEPTIAASRPARSTVGFARMYLLMLSCLEPTAVSE